MKSLKRVARVAASFMLILLYVPMITGAEETVVDIPVVETQPDHLVVMQVQTESRESASSEYVLVYNPTDREVEVTGMCVLYSSASGKTTRQIGCAADSNESIELWLDAGGLMSFTTDIFNAENPEFRSDFGLASGMNSSGGHVYLEDANATEIDRIGWGSATQPEESAALAHDDGQVHSRTVANRTSLDTDNNADDFSSQPIMQLIESGVYEQAAAIDRCINIDGAQLVVPAGYLADDSHECYLDFCPNIDGLQIAAPDGYEKLPSSEACTLVPVEDAAILITELLPNAPSIDTGQEFIELYNPNNRPIDLQGYALQTGPAYNKDYTLKSIVIQPNSYVFVHVYRILV